MEYLKRILLGSVAALTIGPPAEAADLPVRKADLTEYVKVCDAYGAGFFSIPGTDTCLKVGGRVRVDYSFSQRSTIYSAGTINGITGATANTVLLSAGSAPLQGWEARGRVDLDARTQTPWGTVQTVAALRLSRTTGILNSTSVGLSPSSATPVLEAAYIRYMGFTFGAARDNFAFMPATLYGAGHWASFPNGAKQLAYTAVLGGGVSATVAVQDLTDTTSGGIVAASTAGLYTYRNPAGSYATTTIPNLPGYSYNGMPQFNGRLDLDQQWGAASALGAIGRVNAVNSLGTFNEQKTVWALGAGLKINLPMIAAGDVLWMNGVYADGMTEYTLNWLYFKPADTRRNTGGFVSNAPSWVATVDANGQPTIQTLRSWNLAAVFTHYWSPQWRHSFLASYGQIEGSSLQNALLFDQPGAFGDARTWNLGTQLAWLPTSNFEIGVDVLYNHVSQNVVRALLPGTSGSFCTVAGGAPAAIAGCATRETQGNWTGRLRAERTF